MKITKHWTYNYQNKCDCSDDDNCGCSYPENMKRNYEESELSEKVTAHKAGEKSE